MPLPPCVRRVTCRLCNSARIESVLPLTPTPIGDQYLREGAEAHQECFPLELFLCQDCGLAQLVDVVNPELLYADFTYRTALSLGLVEHFRAYCDRICSYAEVPDQALVVDVGSNDGTLLRAFQERGLRTLGVDPARAIALEATRNGIETLPEFFSPDLAEQLRRERGQAHVITSNNTMANIDQLDGIVEGIRTLLHPQGIFAFETGTAIDLVEHGLFDNIYHEHLSYFSTRSLERFFRERGLELVEVERIATKGGSMRGFVQHAQGPRPRGSSLDRLLADEQRLRIYAPEPYAALAGQLAAARRELEAQLTTLQRDGRKLAGYGASVGTTTLLYHLGLGPFLEVLYDDNPGKHGTVSPGYRIPVRPSEQIYADRPDVIVVLSWRYHEPIRRRHTRYLEEGGRFVLPWPPGA